jgi:hypothetical protein
MSEAPADLTAPSHDAAPGELQREECLHCLIVKEATRRIAEGADPVQAISYQVQALAALISAFPVADERAELLRQVSAIQVDDVGRRVSHRLRVDEAYRCAVLRHAVPVLPS